MTAGPGCVGKKIVCNLVKAIGRPGESERKVWSERGRD